MLIICHGVEYVIPEEIKEGAVYRVFGTSLYMGRVIEFNGIYASMKMLTGKIIHVPWYELNLPVNISKEKIEENADKVYIEEEAYLEGSGTRAIY